MTLAGLAGLLVVAGLLDLVCWHDCGSWLGISRSGVTGRAEEEGGWRGAWVAWPGLPAWLW